LVRAAGVDLVGSWPLPDPSGGETRRLMCVSARAAGTASPVVCGTHVSYEQGGLEPQVATIAGVLRGVGGTGVLGGAFNTEPGDARLNALYDPCHGAGAGRFTEADTAGCDSRATTGTRPGRDEDTFAGRKLDYLFLSAGRWSAVRARVADPAGG